MTGVEIDMIVTDSRAALELYERIFEVERIEVTDLSVGRNEAVFTVFGTRFHLLDENPELNMHAPKPGDPKPIWFNTVVPDIRKTYENAIKAGCTEVSPVTEMPEMGIANAMFTDGFGYIWMLHQIYREVSFEERVRYLEEKEKAGGE